MENKILYVVFTCKPNKSYDSNEPLYTDFSIFQNIEDATSYIKTTATVEKREHANFQIKLFPYYHDTASIDLERNAISFFLPHKEPRQEDEDD